MARGGSTGMQLRKFLCLLLAVLTLIPRPALAGLSVLVGVEKDDEAWHNIDRKHFLTLVSSSADSQAITDALYAEWTEITSALQRELTKSVYVDPEMGFRVYDSAATSRIHVLSLAKKAREAFLALVASGSRLPYASVSYPGMFEPQEADGTSLDQNGLRKVAGAAIARVQDCVAALKSLRGIPPGALKGFAYFISPFVFPADVGHAFSSNQPGPDEWVAISALVPGFSPEGFPRDTVIHETGHLIHFEYMGPVDQDNSLWKEYAALRGKPINDVGRWETLTVENFAEDFRVSFSDSAAAHRGSYPAPDQATRKAIMALVQKAVGSGSAGHAKITDLRFDDGTVTLSNLNAPASTGVFVTREDSVELTGVAEALTPGSRPVIVLSPGKGLADSRWEVEGRFAISAAVPKPGVYALRKGYFDVTGRTLWQYDTSMLIIKLGPEASRFRDITFHWGKRDFLVLLALGVVTGYPDGTLRPDASVTRAEFIKMLAKLTGLQPKADEVPFKDLAGHWSAPYVAAVCRAGWLNVNRYGKSFDPDGKLSREEMAEILSMVVGRSHTARHVYSDVGAESGLAIGTLLEKGILKGFPDGRFYPNRPTTRAEAVAALARVEKAILDR